MKLKELVRDDKCDTFCDALYNFEKISCFLSLTTVDSYETANAFLNTQQFTSETERVNIGNAMINKFTELSKNLYNQGMETYLSDCVHGDLETFYAHVLWWYLPEIVKTVYHKYGLGPGIFTMEGFEAINFSTKTVLRNKSNHKGNVCSQTLIQLVSEYMNFEHDVEQSFAHRKKQKEKIIAATKRIHHGNNNNENDAVVAPVVAL